MNKVIYTASIGEIYRVFEPTFLENKGWRIVCITDRDMELKGWEVMKINKSDYPVRLDITNVKFARYIKTHPHIFFPDADISIWIDTKFTVTCDLDEVLRRYLPGDRNFVIMDHNRRNCIYEEAEIIYRDFAGQDKVITEVKKQMDEYAKKKMPAHNGLYSSGIMIRRHMIADVIKFNELWWKEIQKHSQRDMISIAYLLWKNPNMIKLNLLNFKKTYEMFKKK